MGAGKTTVGCHLGDRLGRPVLDSDREIEARTGLSVEQMWRAGEVDRFRDLESVVLAEALDGDEPAVIGAAGGVVLREENRVLLGDHWPVVWLRARPETLIARVGDGSGRPLLAGDPAAAIARLDAERRPFYEGLADVVVDVDGLEPDDVADRIAAELGL